MGWLERRGFIGCDRVVAEHDDLGTKLAEEVGEVVGERVVVVDQEQGHLAGLREVDRGLEGRKLAQALLVLGARVAVGDDPRAGLE